MTINKQLNKSVKTPNGLYGLPRTLVVMGQTTSGLFVTPKGLFINKTKNLFANPTYQDVVDALQMVVYHRDRLSGGLVKDSLSSAYNLLVSKEEKLRK